MISFVLLKSALLHLLWLSVLTLFLRSFWIFIIVSAFKSVFLHRFWLSVLTDLVGPSGLEPPTSCLSGTRSNHLSYEPSFLSSCTIPFQWSFRSYLWWRWWDSNPWPPACRAGALPAELHPHIFILGFCFFLLSKILQNWTTLRALNSKVKLRLLDLSIYFMNSRFSIDRRWSSRTFRYGYLVTT